MPVTSDPAPQPMCHSCWTILWPRIDATEASVRLTQPLRCAWCGNLTIAPVIVRANLNAVPYPTYPPQPREEVPDDGPV